MRKRWGRTGVIPGGVALLGLLAMAACGQSDDAQGIGGLSKGEADALNQAAAMLDNQANSAEAALKGNAAE